MAENKICSFFHDILGVTCSVWVLPMAIFFRHAGNSCKGARNNYIQVAG